MEMEPIEDFQPIRRGTASTFLYEEPTPKVIEDFMKHYHYKQAHYDQLANHAKELIEREVKDAKWKNDVHVKVSARAKEPKSLKEKLEMRYATKNYQTEEDIEKDIHDLAGVRVVLYMPSQDQRDTVEKIIRTIWTSVEKPKDYDKPSDKEKPEDGAQEPREETKKRKRYRRRHPGYQASHYRVKMEEKQNNVPHYHYQPGDEVEVQVVSALSHAWAEAGHDIIYKTHAFGQPTVHEELLLDALNGIVLSGDLLLEQFHEVVKKRTTTKFAHRSEFGTFLRELDILEPQGDVERQELDPEALPVLYHFLQKTGQDYPLAVRAALKELGRNLGSLEDLDLERYLVEKMGPRFTPSKGMLATVCFLHHMMPKYTEPSSQGTPLRERCLVMINALILLRTFFGGPNATNRYLRELKSLKEDERKSVNELLTSIQIQQVLEPPKLCDRALYKKKVETIGQDLEPAWKWFQKEARDRSSVCGMVFRLAGMGVTKQLEGALLNEQLDIKTILSRPPSPA